MATNFGTNLAVNGLVREIRTWEFHINDGLVSVNPYVCWSLSLVLLLRRVGTAPGGQLSGWELTR